MSNSSHHFGSYVFWTGLTIWVIGFFIFSLISITMKYMPLESADAIVILTGGTDRIKEGIELLKEDTAPQVFISGVNKFVKEEEIFKDVPTEIQSKIHLGYMADSTYTNALETADWIKKEKLNKIILVTSFYHMPRSLMEMYSHVKNIQIVPYPIFPRQFDNSTNWIHTRYAWQLLLEYHKFLVVYFKYMMQRIML